MKEQLIELANRNGFKSKVNALIYTDNEFGYYLWLCELQKWVRDKHKIVVCVECFLSIYGEHLTEYAYLSDNILTGKTTASLSAYDTYEQALEAGLVTALELLTKKD